MQPFTNLEISEKTQNKVVQHTCNWNPRKEEKENKAEKYI